MKETQESMELGLIGAVLVAPALVMKICEARGVSEDWFTSAEAKRVWPFMQRQWRTEGVVDALLLARDLMQPEIMGWLKGCLERTPSSAAAPYYIEQLAKARLQRQVAALGRQLMVDACDLGGQEALNRAESAMAELRNTEKECYGGLRKVADYEEQIMKDYELLHQKRTIEHDRSFFIGLRLPWDTLNFLYTGVKAGLHIVAARPSQGKTALAISMSAGMAHGGVKQLFFSVDMAPRLLVERYGAFCGQASLPRLNFGASKDELGHMKTGLEKIKNYGRRSEKELPNNLLISDAYRVDRIIGEIYRAHKYDGIKCVWIDYLQILAGDRHYASKKDELDDILSKLKQCALSLEIPIFCLAQLNRDTGKDPNREPKLTDLGDTGAIEREASTVLLLWKDPGVRAEWDEAPPYRLANNDLPTAKAIEPMWLILAKNQQGATGKRPFLFYKPWFMFRPGDHDAKPITETDRDGKIKSVDYSPLFNTIRDDFVKLHNTDGTGFDDALYRFRALGPRGL